MKNDHAQSLAHAPTVPAAPGSAPRAKPLPRKKLPAAAPPVESIVVARVYDRETAAKAKKANKVLRASFPDVAKGSLLVDDDPALDAAAVNALRIALAIDELEEQYLCDHNHVLARLSDAQKEVLRTRSTEYTFSKSKGAVESKAYYEAREAMHADFFAFLKTSFPALARQVDEHVAAIDAIDQEDFRREGSRSLNGKVRV